MGTIIAVAIGGAAGSVARHGLTIFCNGLFGGEFPYGIFFANVLGSFAIGVCFVLLLERALLTEVWRSLLMAGFLGGFTTFSTFSLQSIGLVQAGRILEATLYVVGSVVLSILGAWVGILLTRQLTS